MEVTRDRGKAESRKSATDGPPTAACPTEDRAEKERRQAERLRSRLARIDHKIVVLSGKGGVGKSSVSAGLALGLSRGGRRTGLLDIDLHGPSIPRLLGLRSAQVTGKADALETVQANENLVVMSLGFLLPRSDAPVIWRGPIKYHMIKQLLSDVEWGDLDFLVVDSPPSTGDEPLAVGQLVENADGALVVTTPQALATDDVRRSVNFARELSLPVLGVIENMSAFPCPHCGAPIDLFGAGGAEEMCRDMGVPLLGSIPFDPAMAIAGDEGRLGEYLDSDRPSGTALVELVKRVVAETDVTRSSSRSA